MNDKCEDIYNCGRWHWSYVNYLSWNFNNFIAKQIKVPPIILNFVEEKLFFIVPILKWGLYYRVHTLLKSDVTRRDHVVHCHGSQECWFTLCQFRCQFHSRRHSLCTTLKSTTLVHMRSRYAWTRKSWQWSEWRLHLDFNSVLTSIV